MDSFEIIMTPNATKDLLELKDYTRSGHCPVLY